MSCSYRVGGVENALLTEVFNYVEDNPSGARAGFKIENMLRSRNMVFEDGDALFAVKQDGVAEDIATINNTAREFFGVVGDLIMQTPAGKDTRISVNDNILELLNPTSDLQNSSTTTKGVDRVEEVEETVDPLISEAFDRKEKVDDLTDKIITNLQLQIDRLNRLEETDSVKNRRRELELLKIQLRKVATGKERVDNFYDYVDYVFNLSKRAATAMDRIEEEYAVSYKTMPNADRAVILSKISTLKQTLDAFYTENRDLSVSNQLADKLVKMQDESGTKDELLDKLVISLADMKDLNDRYLEIAIPIQADLLLEYAPMEVNQKLYASIERLEAAIAKKDFNVPYEGLKRRDPRAIKIMRETLKLGAGQERRERLMKLNVIQLKKQIVGRESIIQELRETHQDASSFSMYADPLVYNSELNIQLFANAVKSELFDAHQKTIDVKYQLEPAFKKFRAWRGVSEDRPDKFYKDLFETVNIARKQEDGTIKMIPVLSFVQPYDMKRFQAAKTQSFEAAKKAHNYPKDNADLDDFFRSANGRKYNAAVAKWYAENTEEVQGARDIIDGMLTERDNLDYARIKAFKDGKEETGKELTYQYHALELEIKKVYRRGKNGMQIVGNLTVPNQSYNNTKYTSMPAEAKEFYDVLLDIYKTQQKKLGKGGMSQNSWDNFSYILPSVRKSALDIGLEGNPGEAVTDVINDAFYLQETDTDFGELVQAGGERMKFIPRYFTNVVEEAKVSKNIVDSIVKFTDMSNRYEAKAKMLGMVNVMHDAIASRGTLTMTESGNYLTDRTAQKLGYNLELKAEGKKSNTYIALESFIDNVIYGESIKGNAKKTVLGKLSVSKLVGQASTMTALARLSGNMLQATNQLIIDSTMNAQEGWANQFYSRSDLSRARFKVLASMSSEGLSPKFNKETKLNKMLEMFDALQEHSQAFEKTTGSAVKKATDFGTAFAAQRGMEWQTTAEKMVALAISLEGTLKDKNGKVIKTKEGKEANLWDMMEINSKGRLVVNSEVANFGKKELAAFASKLNGITKRTNQLKGPIDKTLLERQNVTRPLMLFRKFLVPAYRKRFGHSTGGYHVDVELADITEGYYTTVARAIGSSLALMRRGEVARAFNNLNPFSKDLSDLQKQNLKRVYHEQIYLSMLGLMTSALGAAMDDDDEFDNFAGHFAIYQAHRLKTELNAFRDPSELFRLMKNPTAASQLVEDNIQLLQASMDLLFNSVGIVPDEDVYYQRRAGRMQKGDLKWTKELLDVLPIAAGLYKSVDPEQASKYYELTSKK
jgi:hypothetical protein